MICFIDDYRDEHGVEPICQQLPLSVSTYYWHKEREQHPEKAADRHKRDQQLIADIQRIRDDNQQVYGARKVWLQLKRETINVARCTVERLMKHMGIQGVSRATAG
ncbi:MAG: IS3 family transposase [Thiolinea sp.]